MPKKGVNVMPLIMPEKDTLLPRVFRRKWQDHLRAANWHGRKRSGGGVQCDCGRGDE